MLKIPSNWPTAQSSREKNLQKIAMSYPDADWHQGLVMGKGARVGVRMVTRDHFPMLGQAPDVGALMQGYQQHQHTPESARYWQQTQAPVHPGLYVLGGLGSRGLSTGVGGGNSGIRALPSAFACGKYTAAAPQPQPDVDAKAHQGQGAVSSLNSLSFQTQKVRHKKAPNGAFSCSNQTQAAIRCFSSDQALSTRR